MKWRRSRICSFLYDENGKEILRILTLSHCYEVMLTVFNEYERIQAGSIEESEWRAVLLLYDRCNQMANYYHRIRDRLPSIHELADRAGI